MVVTRPRSQEACAGQARAGGGLGKTGPRQRMRHPGVGPRDVVLHEDEHAAGLQPPGDPAEDSAGIGGGADPRVTPDGRSYAYNYSRYLSDLYVVEGLK